MAVAEVVPDTRASPSLELRAMGSSPARFRASSPGSSPSSQYAFPFPSSTSAMWASGER